MEPYNIKVLTYPDLTKQVRIYKKTICSPNRMPDREQLERNPFDGKTVRNLKMDIDSYDFHVDEVSMKRTKKKIYDYAKCNEWDWFVTLTFSSKKVNRYDYDECCKKLKGWLDYLRRSNPGLSYVVVPEMHKDGAWHFHGLFAGLSDSEIVWSGKYVIKRVRGLRSKFVKTDQKIYKIGKYKLGWMTATEIREKERVVSYITKYVTKDMMRGLLNRKRYWASRGLLVPQEETYNIDEVDRFILSTELSDDARYRTVSEFSYGTMTQSVEIFEL